MSDFIQKIIKEIIGDYLIDNPQYSIPLIVAFVVIIVLFVVNNIFTEIHVNRALLKGQYGVAVQRANRYLRLGMYALLFKSAFKARKAIGLFHLGQYDEATTIAKAYLNNRDLDELDDSTYHVLKVLAYIELHNREIEEAHRVLGLAIQGEAKVPDVYAVLAEDDLYQPEKTNAYIIV